MASQVLALLEEPDYTLKEYALQTLGDQVNELWPEIADHIPIIEELHEDRSFPAQNLAALVVAKVYYNLGDLDLALKFALAAGPELDLTKRSEFLDTVISHGIKTYINHRQRSVDNDEQHGSADSASGAAISATSAGSASTPLLTSNGNSATSAGSATNSNGVANGSSSGASAATDGDADLNSSSQLKRVVEEMLERCFASGQVTLALGIALEARRLDLVERQLQSAHDPETLAFVLDTSITLVSNRSFRTRVLRSLNKVVDAAMHMAHDYSQYYSLATKIAIQLDDSELAIRLLGEVQPEALALQVAFDLVATASQELRDKTADHFANSSRAHHARLVKILSGVPTCDYMVSFLDHNNHTDLNMLHATKNSLDSRNSMFHSALSFQNALLHLGTTYDGFLRSNIDWLGQAKHWTRFTATAALGVIHQGNLTQGRRVLQPYLSKSGADSSHIKGGAHYGLGLVFAGFGKEILAYLQDQLSELSERLNDDSTPRSSDGPGGVVGGIGAALSGQAPAATATTGAEEVEVLIHGVCLGAALAAMRTQNSMLYSTLREILYTGATTAGEAAGISMGLVMLGSRDLEVQEEMLHYSRNSEHERVVRSLAVGLALLNYGKEEASDKLSTEMLGDHDAILRYGGCFTLALAYAGTGSGKATKRLLHAAVSDSSDDVRRAAVMALGFIYIRQPAVLPRMVELLSESHNPHVRYGTAIALGVACAGSGLAAALDVLEPLIEDPVDFVRQGAMIAMSMILVQHTDQNSRVARGMREHLAKITATKNEDALAKFGAAIGQGIIDAGGCNATITLEHRQTSNLNMRAVTGIAVFLQYWYWFPLAHFISLAYTPTTVVCVTPELTIPEMDLECVGAPARRFDYPSRLEEPSSKAPEQLVTAILSTTLRDRRKRKEKESKDDDKEAKVAKDVKDEKDAKTADSKEPKEPKDAKEVKDSKDAKDSKDSKDSKESKSKDAKDKKKDVEDFTLPNMSRVVPWQREFIHLPAKSLFEPTALRREPNGVVVVTQKAGDTEPVTYMRTLRQQLALDNDLDDAPVPRPFKVAPDENLL